MPSSTGLLRRISEMKVKYFSDTDTALVEFTNKEIYETKEISKNIYVDVDRNGDIVNCSGPQK